MCGACVMLMKQYSGSGQSCKLDSDFNAYQLPNIFPIAVDFSQWFFSFIQMLYDI
jgi:hypothetical protein